MPPLLRLSNTVSFFARDPKPVDHGHSMAPSVAVRKRRADDPEPGSDRQAHVQNRLPTHPESLEWSERQCPTVSLWVVGDA